MIDIAPLFGQPAISLRDAERKGAVKGLQFEGQRISFIDIGTDRPIPAEAVRSFEGDALTYETEDDESSAVTTVDAASPAGQIDVPGEAELVDGAEPIAGEPSTSDEAAKPWSGNPLGHRILSDTGNELGTLAEMHIEADGTVVEMVDDHHHRYAGERLVAVGSYAVVVTAASDDDERP